MVFIWARAEATVASRAASSAVALALRRAPQAPLADSPSRPAADTKGTRIKSTSRLRTPSRRRPDEGARVVPVWLTWASVGGTEPTSAVREADSIDVSVGF